MKQATHTKKYYLVPRATYLKMTTKQLKKKMNSDCTKNTLRMKRKIYPNLTSVKMVFHRLHYGNYMNMNNFGSRHIHTGKF